MILALRRLGLAVEPYVPSPARRGARPVAGRGRAGPGDRGSASSSRSTAASTSAAEIAAANAAGIDVLVTDHHRVPAVAAAGPRARQSAPAGRHLPGPAARGQRRRVQARPAAPRRRARRTGARARPVRPRDVGAVADVAPILGENRAIARLGLERLRAGRRPGLAALLARAGIDAASASTSRPSPSRSRRGSTPPVGWGRRSRRRGCSWREDPTEAAALADGARGGEPDAARPDEDRRSRRRGAWSPARTGPRPPRNARAATVVRGDWPVGIVGLVAVAARRRPGLRGGRRCEPRRRRPGIVPERRVAGPRRGARRLRRPLHPPRRPRRRGRLRDPGRALGGLPRALPAARRGRRRRPIAGPSPGSTSPSRPPRVGYDLVRELAALAPFGPGHPDPLVAILGLTVTRVRSRDRRAHPADAPPRPRRARRDRVRPGRPRGERPRGRPGRRRRADRQPARSAASRRSRSRSATSRRSGHHPEAAAILAAAGIAIAARRPSRSRPSEASRDELGGKHPRHRDAVAPCGPPAEPRPVRHLRPCATGSPRSSPIVGLLLVGWLTWGLRHRQPRAAGRRTGPAPARIRGRRPARRPRRTWSWCPRTRGRRSRVRSCTSRPATSGSRAARAPAS